MSKFYIVSLDPAQLNDYSALAVLEVEGRIYRIVSLSRKQHVPYTEIVAWAKKVYENPMFREDVAFSPTFLIDIGGVGRAIGDMLTAAGVPVTGIQLTGGDAETKEGSTFHVSKSLLVGRFLRAWDEGRVQMPSRASFLGMLQSELRAFRGEMSSQGRVRFEAMQGEHDDLILSVAQAVWWADSRPRPQKPFVQPRPDYKITPAWKTGSYNSGFCEWKIEH